MTSPEAPAAAGTRCGGWAVCVLTALTALTALVLVGPGGPGAAGSAAYAVESGGAGDLVVTAPQTTLTPLRSTARRAPHVVRYRIETRGRITASMEVFRRSVQQTFDARQGWRAAGVTFRRVATGGTLSVVLSEASRVPSFSSACSSQWSCRVGRYVIINQLRWRQATPMWHDRGRSLRSYRHLVVNHETGHWLGLGHRGCPRPGSLAPVMMQQSIDLQGCRPNPWPLPGERNVPRF